MFVANGKKIYGSDSASISTKRTHTSLKDDVCDDHIARRFTQVIKIIKTHMKAVDKPTQRCSESNENTSICIAKFVEKQLGCNSMILGSQHSEAPQCTTKSQLMALANLSRVFEDAHENKIFEMTGCLSSCEKHQYSLSVEPLQVEKLEWYENEVEQCQVHLKLQMLDSAYKEEEQYVIYDTASFIADVGGYMGLLLGSSLLSLYMAIEACLRKAVGKPKRGTIEA